MAAPFYSKAQKSGHQQRKRSGLRHAERRRWRVNQEDTIGCAE
jgi:hypothetical protein